MPGRACLLYRYLNRELLMTFLLVTGLLMLIFMSQQFVEYMTKIAAGNLPGIILFKLMLLHLPFLLGLLLPLGLFLSLLLTLGKLAADQELTIIENAGVGPKQLMMAFAPTLVFALISCLIINFWLSPKLMNQKYHLLAGSPLSTVIDTLTPGRFKAIDGGKRVIYIQSVSRNHHKMRGIFLAEQVDNTTVNNNIPTWRILTARQAEQKHFPSFDSLYIVARDGQLLEGQPGEKALRLANFTQYGLRSQNNLTVPVKQSAESYTTPLLLKMLPNNAKARAEFIWRVNIVISMILLTWLGLSLGKLAPRQGRYAKLLPGILIYTVYANLLMVSRNWIGKEKLSWWVCLMLTHLVVLLALAWLNRKTLKGLATGE